jgi:hypothetical protein
VSKSPRSPVQKEDWVMLTRVTLGNGARYSLVYGKIKRVIFKRDDRKAVIWIPWVADPQLQLITVSCVEQLCPVSGAKASELDKKYKPKTAKRKKKG